MDNKGISLDDAKAIGLGFISTMILIIISITIVLISMSDIKTRLDILDERTKNIIINCN